MFPLLISHRRRWKLIADREFRDRVDSRTLREMDQFAVSPTKLRIGVPIAEGAIPIYREQLLECSLSHGALMRQVVLWAADGGMSLVLKAVYCVCICHNSQ